MCISNSDRTLSERVGERKRKRRRRRRSSTRGCFLKNTGTSGRREQFREIVKPKEEEEEVTVTV